jgi:hypothetical protein
VSALTKGDLLRHMLADHDPHRIFEPTAVRCLLAERESKVSLESTHQQLHASLADGHAHDPKSGRPVPIGDTLI